MHQLSLVDVLQKLGSDALDGFVSRLQQDKSLKSLRLVSRSMLHVVDNSVKAVQLTVRSTDRALVIGGASFPLCRWWRCSSIRLALDAADWNNPDAASILLLPFVGLPLEARQRITSVSALILSRRSTAIALLLHRLPALQNVSLHGKVPADPVEQQLLTDALGSLPHLKELTLWCGPGLDKVDLAAVGLQKLTVYRSEAPLDAPKVSAIGRLRQLRHLTVEVSVAEAAEQLRLLLSALPPSVTTLELPECPVVNYGNLKLRFDGGCVRTITLESRDDSYAVGLDDLNELAAGLALLPRGAVGSSQVERISLSRMQLMQHEAERLAEGPESQQLRSLLQRSTVLKVRCLLLARGTSARSFLKAFPLLGRGVRSLELALPVYQAFNFCLELHDLDRHTASWLPGSDGAASCTQQPEQLPVAAGCASLMGLALERQARADTGLPPAGSQASDAAAAAAAAASDGSGAGQLGGPNSGSLAQNVQARAARPAPPVPLLMLHGPLVAALGHSEGNADALGQWMQRLVKLAAEAAGLSGEAGTGAAAAGEQPMLHYLHLPTADAVLVRCTTAEGLAAAAAAARAVAESAASRCCGGTASSSRTTQLHVTTACVGQPIANPSYRLPTLDNDHMRRLQVVVVLMHFLDQVIQSVLDGEGLSAGWSQRQRLGWVVEQWSRLAELPFPRDL